MMHRTIAVAILAYIQVSAVNAQGGSKGRPIKYICPKDDGQQYTTYVVAAPPHKQPLCVFLS